MGGELRRVDVDGDDDGVGPSALCGAGEVDQGEVAGVQAALI